MEHEKSDRLTVAKLNITSKPHKQDYKSKLMTEKYSLLLINPQQLTSVQTALQRMSEKHPVFEIQAVNTIRPTDIEYMLCISKTACFPVNYAPTFPPVKEGMWLMEPQGSKRVLFAKCSEWFGKKS